jgi:RNA polymerase-binding transcription factor DksA
MGTTEEEFRDRLCEARTRLHRTVGRTDDELATPETHQPGAPSESVTTEEVTAILSRLEGQEKHELDEIDAAQAAAGTYGVCEGWANPIPLARHRPATVAPDVGVAAAGRLLREEQIRHLPVADDDRLFEVGDVMTRESVTTTPTPCSPRRPLGCSSTVSAASPSWRAAAWSATRQVPGLASVCGSSPVS